MVEFKGSKGKFFSKVTRSSNVNGDEAIVIFSTNDNPPIDKGICRFTILNHEGEVVQDVNEMKANVLLMENSKEMLEMLQYILEEGERGQYIDREDLFNIKQLIKQATEL